MRIWHNRRRALVHQLIAPVKRHSIGTISAEFKLVSLVLSYPRLSQPVFANLSNLASGRPVCALCDALMHHGQSRRKRKTHKVCKSHAHFTKSGRKFGKVEGKETFSYT